MGSNAVGFSGSPTLTQVSTGTTTPGTTGLSNYSQDLQNQVNRQVALASLPMQELQNQVNQLTSQSSELNTLSGNFQALQSAIANLDTASQGILAPSVSNSNVLSASVGAGALPGAYSVQVTQAGVFASAMSSSGVADPTSQSIDPASSFSLSVNGVGTAITPATNTLNALVAAINATPAAGVQATLVNVGSSSSPNYELSLQNTAFGNVPITLTATGSSSNLLTPLAPGADFQYKVNGFPATALSSTSGSVTLSPGVTVSLLGTGTSTVTVAPSSASLSNALSSFANTYNSAVDELGKNIGKNGGALGGDNIVYTLQQTLNDIGTFNSATNGVTSLSDVGLTFDTSGHLNFDPTVLAGASGTQLTNIGSFLGGATSGGFLQFATNTLTGIEDPSSGALPNDIKQTANSIASDNKLITTQQARIALLQTTLQATMSKADSAIASLESQQSFFTSLFTSMLIPSPQQLARL
jgi:flagellar hook-associated protein 2